MLVKCGQRCCRTCEGGGYALALRLGRWRRGLRGARVPKAAQGGIYMPMTVWQRRGGRGCVNGGAGRQSRPHTLP